MLLSILILLAKDPVADTPVGHPLFLAMAAVLALPLLTLGPAPLRTWWVGGCCAPLLLAVVQCSGAGVCMCVTCDVALVMAEANDCMHACWQ
jgi:hypothetical protein